MDKRVYKTKQAIDDAFIELLEEKPLEKIMVTDIAKKANIARKTFYAHYKNMNELIDEDYQKMIVAFRSILNSVINFKEEPTLKEIVGLVNFIDHNKHLIKAFYVVSEKNMNQQVFTDTGQLTEKVLSNKIPDIHWNKRKAARLINDFITTGTNQVIKEWVNDPKIMTKEQLIYLLYQFTVLPFRNLSDPQITLQQITKELSKSKYYSDKFFLQ
ncbi:MAG: TetR/AcrR family transcriptional regulator [Lactobacillus sp.]|nr:TetR/AcrR family transcriptional regulator [Lactobacillus sp.]